MDEITNVVKERTHVEYNKDLVDSAYKAGGSGCFLYLTIKDFKKISRKTNN